jgi:Holliday junction resolvasome RuvABC ATP-dependent DNA helicase subunit
VVTTTANRATVTIKPRHAVSSLFQGRRQILEQLSAFFTPRESGKSLRHEFLLYGMGGAGKSQIALKFEEEYEDR